MGLFGRKKGVRRINAPPSYKGKIKAFDLYPVYSDGGCDAPPGRSDACVSVERAKNITFDELLLNHDRNVNSGTLYRQNRSTFSPHKATETHVINLGSGLNITQKFHPEYDSKGPSYEAIFGQGGKSGSKPAFGKTETALERISSNNIREFEKSLEMVRELNEKPRYPAYTAPSCFDAPSAFDGYGTPKPTEQVIRETVPSRHSWFDDKPYGPVNINPWDEPHRRALATDDHYAGLWGVGRHTGPILDPRDLRDMASPTMLKSMRWNEITGQW